MQSIRTILEMFFDSKHQYHYKKFMNLWKLKVKYMMYSRVSIEWGPDLNDDVQGRKYYSTLKLHYAFLL